MKTIFERRKAAGLSQKELSELSTINQSTLSRIERGAAKPTEEQLINLAGTFGCEVEDILLVGLATVVDTAPVVPVVPVVPVPVPVPVPVKAVYVDPLKDAPCAVRYNLTLLVESLRYSPKDVAYRILLMNIDGPEGKFHNAINVTYGVTPQLEDAWDWILKNRAKYNQMVHQTIFKVLDEVRLVMASEVFTKINFEFRKALVKNFLVEDSPWIQ